MTTTQPSVEILNTLVQSAGGPCDDECTSVVRTSGAPPAPSDPAAGSGRLLPTTGSAPVPYLAVMLAVMVLGAALVIEARRARTWR